MYTEAHVIRMRTVKENTRTEERMGNDEVGKRAAAVDHMVKGKPLWKGNILAKTWSANQRQLGSEKVRRFRGGSQVTGRGGKGFGWREWKEAQVAGGK